MMHSIKICEVISTPVATTYPESACVRSLEQSDETWAMIATHWKNLFFAPVVVDAIVWS